MSREPTVMASGLRRFQADLHIHTSLSPCGSDEMTPPAIVETALARGLDMIAICDHNTAGNVGAVQEAAGSHLTVLAGMELATAEEVHVVGIFPDLEAAEDVAAQVRVLLPAANADYYSFFGGQPLSDAGGRNVGTESVTLALATPFDLRGAVELVQRSGGLAIAAHVDRMAFSVFSQLGFFPEDTGFDGIEVSRNVPIDTTRLEKYEALGLPVIRSSDSHFLEEIGSARTELWSKSANFPELCLAFANIGGRSVSHA